MNEEDDLKRRIQELERENSRLREKAVAQSPTITTRVPTYKGHPVITFEGSFRPFSFGVRKAAAILERIDDVVAFVEAHPATQPSGPDRDDP